MYVVEWPCCHDPLSIRLSFDDLLLSAQQPPSSSNPDRPILAHTLAFLSSRRSREQPTPPLSAPSGRATRALPPESSAGGRSLRLRGEPYMALSRLSVVSLVTCSCRVSGAHCCLCSHSVWGGVASSCDQAALADVKRFIASYAISLSADFGPDSKAAAHRVVPPEGGASRWLRRGAMR